MSLDPAIPQPLREVIDGSFDGRLDAAQWQALQEALLADPAAMRYYVERRWLHAQLLSDGDLAAALGVASANAAGGEGDFASSVEVGPAVPTPPPRRAANGGATKRAWPAWVGWAAAVAAGVALSLALLREAPAPAPSVATLVEAEGCRWEGSELPTSEGARLGAGRLALAEGMASIRFDSGATVTLEAPAVLQVDSAMRCRLVEGSVVADVPESAHGFTILTDELEVIDLGTRFGVTNTPSGGANVFVFEGEVKVRREGESEEKHLVGGRSFLFGRAGESPESEVSRSPETAESPPGWTGLSTAKGRGKDAYIRGGGGSPLGREPLLMVKETDLAPGNVRRAVLTFDLDELGGAQIEAARLALKMESSGLGFSSLVPDSVFALYAVHDPAMHEWDESGLYWTNAGPFAAEQFDPALFEKVGSFEIRKGAPNTMVEVSSPQLDAFLREAEGPFATFLLVRETGEMDKQGLVHAFASKEHPTGPAPTLWLKLSDPTE